MRRKEHILDSWREKSNVNEIVIYPDDTAGNSYETANKSTLLAAQEDRRIRGKFYFWQY